MKIVIIFALSLFSAISYSQDAMVLDAEELKARIIEVNKDSNKVFMNDSTMADVDALFSNYTEDFIYIHEVYGGTYSRKELYENTAIRVKERKYKRKFDRYKIVNIITGYNGAAVERELIDNGKRHLSIFEFRGDKVSKVTEYWK